MINKLELIRDDLVVATKDIYHADTDREVLEGTIGRVTTKEYGIYLIDWKPFDDGFMLTRTPIGCFGLILDEVIAKFWS